MKITVYSIDRASGNVLAGAPAIVLGDDSVGDIFNQIPKRSDDRTVQIDELFGQDQPFTAARGNRKNSFEWRIERCHEDAATAAVFALTHADNVPMDCNLVIEQDDRTWTQVGAVIRTVRCDEVVGRTTVFGYSSVGGVPVTGAIGNTSTSGVARS